MARCRAFYGQPNAGPDRSTTLEADDLTVGLADARQPVHSQMVYMAKFLGSGNEKAPAFWLGAFMDALMNGD